MSKMRELVGMKSRCNACREQSEHTSFFSQLCSNRYVDARCPDRLYAGKDTWKGAVWDSADCAVIRQFLKPEVDE